MDLNWSDQDQNFLEMGAPKRGDSQPTHSSNGDTSPTRGVDWEIHPLRLAEKILFHPTLKLPSENLLQFYSKSPPQNLNYLIESIFCRQISNILTSCNLQQSNFLQPISWQEQNNFTFFGGHWMCHYCPFNCAQSQSIISNIYSSHYRNYNCMKAWEKFNKKRTSSAERLRSKWHRIEENGKRTKRISCDIVTRFFRT